MKYHLNGSIALCLFVIFLLLDAHSIVLNLINSSGTIILLRATLVFILLMTILLRLRALSIVLQIWIGLAVVGGFLKLIGFALIAIGSGIPNDQNYIPLLWAVVNIAFGWYLLMNTDKIEDRIIAKTD